MPPTHNPSSNVLCIGDDSVLLSIRELVLRKAGYTVRSSTSDGILESKEIPEVDLVVLCHTVTSERAEKIAQLLKLCRPGVRIIRLSRHYNVSATLFDSICNTLDGPLTLLREMARVAGLSPARSLKSSWLV